MSQAGESDLPEQNKKILVVKAARHWGWGFLLHSSTFGLYTPFWLVGLLREIRSLNQPGVRPWAWFFVPFITLAQIFAMPRLAKYIRQAETDVGLRPWGFSRFICIVGVIGLTLFFNLQHRIATPTWLIVPSILVWGALFSVVEARFNRVRRALAGGQPERPRSRNPYRWWEWVVLVPLIPFAFVWMPYLSLDSLGVYDVASLPGQSLYQDDAGRYQFPMASTGWTKVSPGTFSDDENELELSGPVDGVFAIVYRYPNLTPEELAYDRKTTFYEFLRAGNCEESRQFIGEGLDLSAHVTCEGQGYGMSSLWTSGIVQGDGAVYELVVHMNVPGASFRSLKPELVEMAKEFAPL